MAKILAVCSSNKKGISKDVVAAGIFRKDYGLEGDAHADSITHRQVSLLALSSIDKMRALGLELDYGSFAENLTVEGMDLLSLPVGTRLSAGEDVVLEITQIGKECHTRCAIYKQVGECVMPTEGVFARVIKGGVVKAGDEIKVI